MAALSPIYRLRVYASDDVTVLTPRAGASHAEAFQVSTHVLSGYRPYLNLPQGRRSRFELLSRKTDVGQMSFELLDSRLVEGGDNLTRFITAFVGDTNGRHLLLGKRVVVEESLQGAGYTAFFAGRIWDLTLGENRNFLTLRVREYAEELKAAIFRGIPHSSITYAAPCSLLPWGPKIDYGGYPAVPKLGGTIDHWSQSGEGSGYAVVLDKGKIPAPVGGGYIEAGMLSPPLKALLDRLPFERHLGSDDDQPENGAIKDVLVEITYGGNTGLFKLARHPMGASEVQGESVRIGMGFGYAYLRNDDDNVSVSKVGFMPLATGEPGYMAAPPDGADVTVRLLHNAAPSKDAPFYIADVHPAQLWADLLDGKFGLLSPATGAALRAVPRDSSAFSARIADGGHGTARFALTKGWAVNEFIEKQLCLPFGLAYRYDGTGAVVPIDVRKPTSLAGLLTINNDDLAVGAPGWSVALEDTIAETEIFYYEDWQEAPIPKDGYVKRPTFVLSRTDPPHSRRVVDLLSTGLGRAAAFVVDAEGLRFSAVGDKDIQLGGTAAQALATKGAVGKLAEELRVLFSGGLATTTLSALRSAASATGCQAGDVRIVDVDEVPDPATNLRGGPRVARCVERSEEGPVLRLVFADMGADIVAVAPSLGALALASGRGQDAVTTAVTLNAASEPATVWFAVTPTATGTRPAETSSLWTFGLRVTTSSTVTLSGMPSGSRVWGRGRSEPAGLKALKLPSGWVFPSGTGRVDTTGISAPTGLSIVSQSGSEAVISFTPGNAEYVTEVLLGGTHIDTLPRGSSRANLRNLTAVAYVVGLRHRDGRGGYSSTSTINLTIAGGDDYAPDPIGISIIVGEPG